jgi:poly(hydroxyalkanoate) granule-associated protein
MPKAKKDDNKNKKEAEKSPLYDMARKVLLASIGAAALAQDEIEQFIDKLVERGEIAKKDGNKLFDEILEKRKDKMARAEEELGNRVDKVLKSMKIPTKKDLDDLTAQLNALSKQIDELKTPKE